MLGSANFEILIKIQKIKIKKKSIRNVPEKTGPSFAGTCALLSWQYQTGLQYMYVCLYTEGVNKILAIFNSNFTSDIGENNKNSC